MTVYGRSRNPGKIDPGVSSVLLMPPSIAWTAAFWASDPTWMSPGDGNAVASWRDYSGHGLDLTQSTGAKQPLFRASASTALRSLATVEFDGINDVLSTTFTSTPQPTSWVIIFEALAAASGPRLIGASGQQVFILTQSGFPKWHAGASNNQVYGPIATTGAHAIRAKILAGISNSVISVDGVSTTQAVNVGSNICDGVQIGGYPAGGSASNIRVAFASVFAGDVTADGNWSAFCAWASMTYGVTLT